MDRAKPLLLADGRLYRFFSVAPALPPPLLLPVTLAFTLGRHSRRAALSVLYALTNTSWRWQLRDDAGRPAVLINF